MAEPTRGLHTAETLFKISGLLPPPQEIDSDTRKTGVKRGHSSSDPKKPQNFKYMAPKLSGEVTTKGGPKGLKHDHPRRLALKNWWIYTQLDNNPL
jgi:hypothetical protein